jgi:hypothetical protein
MKRVAPIELRLLFDRGGGCRVSLLPRRRGGFPEECTVSTANGGSLDLIALDDEWYQDVTPDDLCSSLRAGAVWTHEAGCEWVLAGREIFVLAAGTTHRGFVSHPRLTLGHEHAVLCATSKLPAVEGALLQAGCTTWSRFGDDCGAPRGWVLVADTDRTGRPRGFVPTKPVRLEENSDILNVLRPLPEIEISLEGGVPLGYGDWLAGYPPMIRILGHAEHAHEVLIDGEGATLGQNDVYRVSGWDKPGFHEIWCSNVRRSYTLIRLERTWDAWPAYAFASPGGVGDRVAICGPLVRPLTIEKTLGEVTNPIEADDLIQANPVLLGAAPGEVFSALPRQDIRGARCLLSPPFDAVWALPKEPLQCNKAEHRIHLIGDMCPPGYDVGPNHTGDAGKVTLWCRLILDASRKGLPANPPAARDLWLSYKRFARTLWRRSR